MKERVSALIDNIRTVIYVDRVKLEYLTASLIAGGHVMLADTHGVGKTSLAKALALSIRWAQKRGKAGAPRSANFNRLQCTVDLLPQDILGYMRIAGDHYEMVFNEGPIFSHFLLCDEINLLTPKTQGSFFQAMEEKAVSIEGKTYSLPDLFFIIATMNLKGSHLFPLPSPQLDRFMIELSLGYPNQEDEQAIVSRHGRTDAWAHFGPVLDEAELLEWMDMVDGLSLHPDVLDYLVRLVRATRGHPKLKQGASPRSGVKLSRLARALALVRGLDYVDIDLIKEIAIPAMAHRLECHDAESDAKLVLADIMRELPVDPPYKKLVQSA